MGLCVLVVLVAHSLRRSAIALDIDDIKEVSKGLRSIIRQFYNSRLML